MSEKSTRQNNAAIRQERRERYFKDKEAKIEALRQIRDNPNAAPGERLEAIRLLEKII